MGVGGEGKMRTTCVRLIGGQSLSVFQGITEEESALGVRRTNGRRPQRISKGHSFVGNCLRPFHDQCQT